MQKVNREVLLNQLISVVPGTAFNETSTQSSSFVFKNGKLFTFNGLIACRRDCCADLNIAVPAKSLLELLSKLKEDFLQFNLEESELQIKGKNKRTEFRVEAVNLPTEEIERPGKWRKMPDEFADAVQIVSKCAGPKTSEDFWITCVHMHPEYLEACDNYQLVRYPIKSGIEQPGLIKAESIKKAISFGMNEISETENWVHFRNKSDSLIVSCRITREEYQPLDRVFAQAEKGGKKTTLPKGLKDSISNAEIFSSENADNNVITVKLSKNQIQITGTGSVGKHTERKKITYSGPDMIFLIQPSMLSEVAERYNDCQISDNFLTVSGGAFTYVTCLSQVKDK